MLRVHSEAVSYRRVGERSREQGEALGVAYRQGGVMLWCKICAFAFAFHVVYDAAERPFVHCGSSDVGLRHVLYVSSLCSWLYPAWCPV